MSAEALFACMPSKGILGTPFLADNVLAEGPYGCTNWKTLPGVENVAPTRGRENPYMSSLGGALFEQAFWPCLYDTTVRDFVSLESSDHVKHGFVGFLFDKAGFGEPCQAMNWIGYHYFQYGY